MNVWQRKTKRAIELWNEKGWRGIRWGFERHFESYREEKRYRKWIQKYDTLTDEDRNKIRRRLANLSQKPLISLVMPVYNVEEKWLRLCIESVLKQLYENWEFCIADDSSPSPHIRRVLEEYAAKDKRIKITFRHENGHISAASNSALELADGEFVALLDHDDELAEHALYFVAEEINFFPETDMIYSDEDMIDEQGKRYAPKFKPDWSQDFFYSLNLITHLSVYRTSVLRKINGFRLGTEGSQDYDLALRVIEEIPETHIRHIPHILYHWRAIRGSVAFAADEKPYAHERARQVIREHFARRGIKASVTNGFYTLHRALYDLPKDTFVNLILLADHNTELLRQTIERILKTTDYENFELIVVGAKSQNPSTNEKVKFIESELETSASLLNFAAQKAKGEILIFLENGMLPVSNEWLKEMASHALQREIGAAGAKLVYKDETIRHGGIIIGGNDVIVFAHRDLPKEDAGNFARAQVINNFSAVSGVIAVSRRVFEEIKGFDEKNFADGLYDIDFCLRVREKNYRIVWTPYAQFVQMQDSTTEKVLTRRNAPEFMFFKKKWNYLVKSDPFYSPNFSLQANFSIALPPRLKKPWNK